jgi:hypothetical protein
MALGEFKKIIGKLAIMKPVMLPTIAPMPSREVTMDQAAKLGHTFSNPIKFPRSVTLPI